MFGDEPTEVDCAIFGQVSQVKYHVPDAVKAKQFLKGIYYTVLVIFISLTLHGKSSAQIATMCLTLMKS
jgi:hypothetical protein